MTKQNGACDSNWYQLESALCDTALDVRRQSLERWDEHRTITMIGRDPAFVTLLDKVAKVAAFNEPVLITGESGVGKESLAASLHLLSPRAGEAFVSVNCPQHQDGNLTVSELFGHTRGSFTGAAADRKGFFETAHGGAVFLDEIGDLHMSAQVMLLRALASGEFRPLGSDRTRRVNVRTIAATNRPLEKLVVAEQFRNDLFFRLRYFHLKALPLRERGDDWRLLVDYFLFRLQTTYGVRKRLSAAAENRLVGYHWPGNIRELNSIITNGYAMSDGDVIEPDDFAAQLSDTDGTGQPGDAHGPDGEPYQRMVRNGTPFWEAVRAPFMQRDLNRAQVVSVVRRGLSETGGSYQGLLPLFNLRDDEYQRMMDFLRHHRLKA